MDKTNKKKIGFYNVSVDTHSYSVRHVFKKKIANRERHQITFSSIFGWPRSICLVYFK